MKTKLFVDFDGTVFNTAKFRQRLFDIFATFGFNQSSIKETYIAECLDYLFSPEGQAGRLKKIKDFDDQIFTMKLKAAYSSVSEMLYPESEEFLSKIDKKKYKVILFTLGDENFQSKKVKHSGLEKYRDQVIYTEIQKWQYLKDIVKPADFFVFVDDRGDTCKMVKKNYPKSLPIQIIRPDEFSLLGEGEIYEGVKVKNLTQALKYL